MTAEGEMSRVAQMKATATSTIAQLSLGRNENKGAVP
jgi:hypothetical protein